jgi:hypothetical protein
MNPKTSCRYRPTVAHWPRRQLKKIAAIPTFAKTLCAPRLPNLKSTKVLGVEWMLPPLSKQYVILAHVVRLVARSWSEYTFHKSQTSCFVR